MNARITVNGITYDGIESMPADARAIYEQALARMPQLADLGSGGIPDIAQGKGGPIQVGTTVRQRFVVNGTTYDDLNAMPPDVRRAYDLAMRAMGSGAANVTKNQIQMSFQFKGPKLSFGGALLPTAVPDDPASIPIADQTPRAIGASSGEGGVRFAIIVIGCAAIGLAWWLMSRAR